MNSLPSIELLESTHDFPCSYVLKVIGKTDGGFVSRVVATVRAQLNQESDPPYRIRETSGGRHVSITLEPFFQSAWDVLAVYGSLYELPGLVMVI
ncbi:MAG: hypothetical protein Tsb009_37220 [Planctomycetaceae bacterium]